MGRLKVEICQSWQLALISIQWKNISAHLPARFGSDAGAYVRCGSGPATTANRQHCPAKLLVSQRCPTLGLFDRRADRQLALLQWAASSAYEDPNIRRGLRQACSRRGHIDASQFCPAKIALPPSSFALDTCAAQDDHHRVPDPGRLHSTRSPSQNAEPNSAPISAKTPLSPAADLGCHNSRRADRHV